MKRRTTRFGITLGFSAIVVLLLALVAVALSQIQNLNNSMTMLVEQTNVKVQAANTMRDTIRLRAASLLRMRLMDDAFERDIEMQHFLSLAGQYRIAKEQLVLLNMTAHEQRIHSDLTIKTRNSQPKTDLAASLMINDAASDQIAKAVDIAGNAQITILQTLNELVEIAGEFSKAALIENKAHYQDTRATLFLLTALVVGVCGLIALVVIRHSEETTRQISHHARHDSLTGLINRREFEIQLEQAIRDAKKQKLTHTLLYLDLDQFKIVNDTCGHIAGDQLLCQLSTVLQERMRTSDCLARLGGDEFGLLFLNSDLDSAITLANTIRENVQDYCFSWEGKAYRIGVSIGVVEVNQHSSDIGSVLSAADTACYEAKDCGRNRIEVFDSSNQHTRERIGEMNWAARINDALEHNQFTLYFQPIVPLSAHPSSQGYIEILVRMLDADGNIIPPGAFLPAAERFDLITSLDRWVVRNTIEWLNTQDSEVSVTINLSGRSLSDEHFLSFLLETIKNSTIFGSQICFEITETAAISRLADAQRFIAVLKRIGCNFALDDFGSGLSSFTYLKNLDVDIVKIDGTFVRDIVDDPIDFAMVKSINEIGHVLGKKTVAEFVESDDSMKMLREINVDYAQGYAIAKPAPLIEYSRYAQAKLAG